MGTDRIKNTRIFSNEQKQFVALLTHTRHQQHFTTGGILKKSF